MLYMLVIHLLLLVLVLLLPAQILFSSGSLSLCLLNIAQQLFSQVKDGWSGCCKSARAGQRRRRIVPGAIVPMCPTKSLSCRSESSNK